jgi:hypothetical protein
LSLTTARLKGTRFLLLACSFSRCPTFLLRLRNSSASFGAHMPSSSPDSCKTIRVSLDAWSRAIAAGKNFASSLQASYLGVKEC